MNVGVEVGPMVSSVIAIIVEPILTLKLNIGSRQSTVSDWSYFTPTLPSINGHSLSAINPDFAMFGGQATSVLA
jgi:hypothetical protein